MFTLPIAFSRPVRCNDSKPPQTRLNLYPLFTVSLVCGSSKAPAIHMKTQKMYHWDVKQVILAILIVIAAQPLQASVCSMDMEMNMGMGMDHGMKHAPDAPSPDADCCDHDDTNTPHSCDSAANCGAAPAGAAVFDDGFDAGTVLIAGRLPSFKNGPLTPSFDSPLYRPPIS
jgi:hypothetical protein